MGNNTNYVQITPVVATSSLLHCGERGFETLCVHIYRDDFNERCKVHVCGPKDLVINYRDGEPIADDMFEQLDKFLISALSPFRKVNILVHCHAGVTRSPTIATYVLARYHGIDAFEAAAMVGRAMWQQQGMVPNLTHKAMFSIVKRLTDHPNWR